jgi:phosphotransferase system HPr-like phosphotransfer protein
MKTMNSRVAIDIVMAAQKTQKPVYISRGNIRVDAKSILGVMSLVDLKGVVVSDNDEAVWKEIMDAIEGVPNE